MSYLVTKGRKDANQNEIVEAMRKMGAAVTVLDRPLDLLVGWRGVTLLVEVKDGTKPPSARRLTFDEQAFIHIWEGRGGPIFVVESVEEAIDMLRAFVGRPERTAAG